MDTEHLRSHDSTGTHHITTYQITKLTITIIAYWIAFGPHGPRAQAPPGEGKKVFLYTMLGVVASGVLFAGARLFAGPPPKTMTKEWQEASNEYLLVSSLVLLWMLKMGLDDRANAMFVKCRKKSPILSMVFRALGTLERVWCRARLRRSKGLVEIRLFGDWDFWRWRKRKRKRRRWRLSSENTTPSPNLPPSLLQRTSHLTPHHTISCPTIPYYTIPPQSNHHCTLYTSTSDQIQSMSSFIIHHIHPIRESEAEDMI